MPSTDADDFNESIDLLTIGDRHLSAVLQGDEFSHAAAAVVTGVLRVFGADSGYSGSEYQGS